MARLLLILLLILSLGLNFYLLSEDPPGLYIDEAAIGYNAYTILTKGTDEYGVKYPVFFKSFGDYKMPVYIYLTAISIKIFGKNEFAVRFPSAFFGTLTVLFLYLLLKDILILDKEKEGRTKCFALLAALILVTSPWFFQFVGPAFETTVGLSFFVIASFCFFRFLRKKFFPDIVLSLIFYTLTIFTYHSYRITAPVILIFVILKAFSLIKEKKKKIILFLIIFLLAVPTASTYISKEGRARFAATTAFGKNKPVSEYPILFLKNYITYFSFHFLFSFGDGIGRHQLPDFGPLPRWSLPILLIGIYFLLKKNNSSLFKKSVIMVFFIAPVASSLALPSPHTLRSLLMIVPYTLVISLGIILLIKKDYKHKMFLTIVLTLIVTYEFGYYLHRYYFHYEKTNLLDWGGSYKELVAETASLNRKYKIIALHESMQSAQIYYKFYNDRLSPIVVNFNWVDNYPRTNGPVLLITSFIGKTPIPKNAKFIKAILLPNDNKDVFANLWEI